MSVSIDPYDNEPVLLISFEGQFHPEDVYEMFHTSSQFASEAQVEQVWRLIDLTRSNIQFADVIALVKQLQQYDQPGDFSDATFQSIFCPSHPMAKLLSELLSKPTYGSVHAPVFPGLGEALLFVQDDLDRGKQRAEV